MSKLARNDSTPKMKKMSLVDKIMNSSEQLKGHLHIQLSIVKCNQKLTVNNMLINHKIPFVLRFCFWRSVAK